VPCGQRSEPAGVQELDALAYDGAKHGPPQDVTAAPRSATVPATRSWSSARADWIHPVVESLGSRRVDRADHAAARDAGLRVTATRVSVLGVLDASTDHPRVDQIIDRVRGSGTSISSQAAYDVCEALHDAGLARKIEPAGGRAVIMRFARIRGRLVADLRGVAG
jgi:hypothetical protein